MTLCPHAKTAAKRLHDHITLDLDDRVRPPKRYFWYFPQGPGLRSENLIKCVHWRLSASKHGIHVMLCLRRDVTPIEKFIFRMWNKDDIWRLSYDMIRYNNSFPTDTNLYATGVLFDFKNGKEAGEWH